MEGGMKRAFFVSIVIFLFYFYVLYGVQKQSQEKMQEKLQYEVTVTLAVVEVFVTDKEGNFVGDLTKDDFEIYEDGKKVAIQYFAIVTSEERPIEKERPARIEKREIPPSPQETKLVVLFDNINTHRFYLVSHWPQIVEMLEALSSKVRETMIIELNRTSGMRIIQPFTLDQKLLVDKIASFKSDAWKEIEEQYFKSQLEMLAQEAALSLEDRLIADPVALAAAITKESDYLKRERLGDSFSAFLVAVNYIRRFEGVKSILIVSDGFHLKERGQNLVRIFDPFEVFGGKKLYEQREAFEKFLELINEERLIFYAISPRGLKQYFSMSARQAWPEVFWGSEIAQWEKERYSLDEITSKTGGMHLKGAKKYESFVQELGRDLTHFYDISYTPPKESRRRGFHKIDVKVKRPGVLVRHREGYTDFSEEDVENRALASAFISPSFFRDIAFSCMADVLALRGGEPEFWVRMEIPLDQFKTAEAGLSEDINLIFGISQWKESKIHLAESIIGIKNFIEGGYDRLYHSLGASGVKLKPGSQCEMRVILNQAGTQIGGWETTLEIPDLRKVAPFSVINLILGVIKEGIKEEQIPFSLSKRNGALQLTQGQFFPSVKNEFSRESGTALFLQISTHQEMPDFALQFALSDDAGTAFQLPSNRIESYYDKRLKLLNEVYHLDFKDIPPGDYQLGLTSPEKITFDKKIEVKILP